MVTVVRNKILYPVLAALLTALLLWLAGFGPRIGPSFILPEGMVAAFDSARGCPSGWDNYEQAMGRTIIGAGQGRGLSQRTFRDHAGSEKVTLTEAEMPRHTHSGVVAAATGVNAAHIDTNDPQNLPQVRASIGNAGGSQPHDNMPPFYVLHYCIKN